MLRREEEIYMWVDEVGLSCSHTEHFGVKEEEKVFLHITFTGFCFTQYHLWQRKSEAKVKN